MTDDKAIRFANATMQAGFTMIPNGVLTHPELSNPAKTLYAHLARYAWQADECFPGQERLGEDMRLSDRQVRALVTELRKAGLVDTRRRGLGQSNVYVLLDPADLSLPVEPEVDIRSDRKPTSDKEDSVEEDSVQQTATAPPAAAGQEPQDDPVLEVWGYWISRRRPLRQDLEDAQRRLIQKALNAGFTVPELWKAIDGLLASDWHRENSKLHLSTIFATRPGGPTLRDQISSWIERAAPSKPKGGGAGVSAEAISRAKTDVLRAWQMPRSSHAVSQGEKAKDVLRRHGITVVRDSERNGRPQFVEVEA